MFIELTDHLRCPANHEEAFLVLLPEVMDGRLVSAGTLGCPMCHREIRVAGGIADFGGGEPAMLPATLSADAAVTLLGLDGPGGYLALFGSSATLGDAIAVHLPGIRLVLVNPPMGLTDSPQASIVRSPRSPIKARSMRGAIIPGDLARQPRWLEDGIACVLPGLRVVGEGPAPDQPALTILAEAGGWWVGRRGGG